MKLPGNTQPPPADPTSETYPTPGAFINGVRIPISSPGVIRLVSGMLEEEGLTELGARLDAASFGVSTRETPEQTLVHQQEIGRVIVAKANDSPTARALLRQAEQIRYEQRRFRLTLRLPKRR